MNRSSVKEALRQIWLEAWRRKGDNPFDPVTIQIEEIAWSAYQEN
jgi:hypothetical protein